MITNLQIRDMVNTGAAALNRNLLAEYGVVAVSLAGGEACGKTSLLEATIHRLGDERRIGMIVGGIRADRDAERLKTCCSHVATLEAMDVTASLVRESLEAMDLTQIDLLLIERAGAAAIPNRGYDDLGQTFNVGMLSLGCGGHKAAGYLNLFKSLDLLLLSKADFQPINPAELAEFHSTILSGGVAVPILEISTITGQGMDRWCRWLRNRTPVTRTADPSARLRRGAEYFIG